MHPDDALESLQAIESDFADFCASRGKASEADTRAKVIDRILKEVCGWPETHLSREDHTESGYSDYLLEEREHPLVVVEAKREGESFLLPESQQHSTYSLNGVLMKTPEIKSAIEQVQSYCVEHAARFAIATNGYTWIVFRAVRDDLPWRKGQAYVFPSLGHIREHIAAFLDLLSHDAVVAGSLQDAFSANVRASRQFHRVSDILWNSELPLQRNRLSTDIQPIIKLFFEDIANQESLSILQSCYIHTGTLKTVANDLDSIITETIPKFLLDEGTVSVGASGSRSGFERVLLDSVLVTKGDLFLLLGGIGSGKSTFLKRYLRTTGKEMLERRTMWFLVDFLESPLEVGEMEPFVWKTLLEDIRTRYAHLEPERRKYLHDVFETNISAVKSTLLCDLKPGSPKYNAEVAQLLERWKGDVGAYVPKLLRCTCKRNGIAPVIFIDNVDQLAPEYQAKIFLLAQRVARTIGCIAVVALREESYYSAAVKRTFTAYSTRRFHIASPHFKRMIRSRIKYALANLEERIADSSLSPQEHHRLSDMASFLNIVRDAMLHSRKISRFIMAICHGNMRFALEMFSTFTTSGATDVNKMLRIYDRDGAYHIAWHEFVKAVMLRDRAYYKEEHSPIANLFNVGGERNSSHFTAVRLLRVLMSHRGESTTEGQGYVEVGRLIYRFEDVFGNQDDLVAVANRLVSRSLVETNTRSTDTIEGASHIRITSAGWYYLRFLATSFAYLDLVLQDTPVDDEQLAKTLRDSVYQVDNMPDSEGAKLDRVLMRFSRVDSFVAYLEREEASERDRFNLESVKGPLGEPIVTAIRDAYNDEKEWIERRIRENRERYADEADVDLTDEDAQFLEDSEEDESEE